MSADVVDLAARRRKALAESLPVVPELSKSARKHSRVSIAMESSAGRVRVVFGDATGGAEVFLTPDQADHVAKELGRFARSARGLSPDGEPT